MNRLATTDHVIADLTTYTVYQLLVSGSRFADDYDEDAAVEHYLQLHPDAHPDAVRAELDRQIEQLEPDLSKYSIFELFSSGMRFCGDYDEGAAIEHYLELHPQAERAKVAEELRRSLEAQRPGRS